MSDDLLNMAAIEKLKREAFAEGWRACLAALGEAMREASAPMLPEPELPREGTTQWRVLEAIKNNPGFYTSELLDHMGHHHREECSPASVRVAMTRLKGKKLVVTRNNKWFPA